MIAVPTGSDRRRQPILGAGPFEWPWLTRHELDSHERGRILPDQTSMPISVVETLNPTTSKIEFTEGEIPARLPQNRSSGSEADSNLKAILSQTFLLEDGRLWQLFLLI